LNHQGEDRRIFRELIRFLGKKKPSAKFNGRRVLEIGKFFLGTPYAAGTLEMKGLEHLVVNLREFDCVTFVENVVALVCLVKSRKKSFETFRTLLQKIRYRHGRLQGYCSRLHYFSEWIHDNQKRGNLRDVTVEIGGRSFKKAISFMTKHPDLYPPLKNGVTLRGMKSIERTISRRSLCFISKKRLRRFQDQIRDGDLIAITTDQEDLDVQHVGLAARMKNRIHLLHTSSIEGKVILSKKTLYRYLMEKRGRSGIMVARIC
jgi:hypothetical protein